MAFERKSYAERLKESQAALKSLQERVRARANQSKRLSPPTPAFDVPSAETTKSPPKHSTGPSQEPPLPQQHFIAPLLGNGKGSAHRHLTPWAAQLATTLLERAGDQKTSIRLVWPGEIDKAVMLHAVASLSRVLDSNLGGLRTLFYPGTDTTWVTLDSLTTDRSQYDKLCRTFYNGARPRIGNDAFMAVLDACHEANYATREPALRIRQLIPAFRYDASSSQWEGVKELPIDVLVKSIPKLSLRRQLRNRISVAWNAPRSAPGALLVLHREIKKKALKAALGGENGRTKMPFDAILIDASTKSILANPSSVKSIPKHLETIRQIAGGNVGTLIVTNDPFEYLSLSKVLESAGLTVDKQILPCDSHGPDWLDSDSPIPMTWAPSQRTTVNFKVRIVDKHAADLARQIRKIVDAVRNEGLRSETEEPFLRLQQLVLRASLLPGGVMDALSSDIEGWGSLSGQLDLPGIAGAIQELQAQGLASTQRTPTAKALDAASKLLTDCSDATPLAEQLKDQIERYAIREQEEMTIVIFSPRDIAIAQSFLARKLGAQWEAASGRVEWLTLTEALTELTARADRRRLIIVGLNPRILRFLVMQKEVPTRTSLLLPLHQAIRMLPQLRFLASADPLKPYRGRTAELRNRLEACLEDVPNIDILARAYDTRLPAASRQSSDSTTNDPSAYRLRLDDGRHISVSGSVFRYTGDGEHPFRRTRVEDVAEGDAIFEMSDDLRDEVEAVFSTQFEGFQFSQFRSPLDGFRAITLNAIEAKFPGLSLPQRITALQSAMAAAAPDQPQVSPSKLRYWMSLRRDADDTAPHFSREKREYQTFCHVLSVPEAMAAQYWDIIRKVRTDNQIGGRQVAALYSELLLAPESSQIYRNIRPETIQVLHSRARDCVARVVHITPPSATAQN
jgi:hypothetical protein